VTGADSRSVPVRSPDRRPATRTAPLLGLVSWAAGVGLCLVVLGASGHGALSPPPLGSPGRWQAWLQARDPTSAAFALLRMAAIAACWYLAATTVLGAVLRLARAELLVAVADRITVTPVRRLLAGSISLTLAGIGPTGMLAASAQPAPPTTLASTTSMTTVTPTTPAPATTPATVVMRRLPPSAPEADAPRASADAHVRDRWTVQPGDCFWTIAEEVLQRAWGRKPKDAEIVPYWRQLIEANRAELADPNNDDLIFPGQVFTVPSPRAAPAP
jgi:hypothetical protein